jgi:DNA-binding MarR family transcriptional regulator
VLPAWLFLQGAALVEARGHAPQGAAGNTLLTLLLQAAPDDIAPWLEHTEWRRGDSLFEPGDDMSHAFFPVQGTVLSLVLPMRDGRAIEAATIGREGAVGGIVSLGLAAAFTRGSVQIPGRVDRIALTRLEAAKRKVPKVHDLLVRYADCLTAQILQSVGCATAHTLEARCARWLLMAQDRLQQPDIPLTQEALAEMFGVARTYVSRIARSLQRRGAISYHRGVVRIERRDLLEDLACECYGVVRRHYERVLPGAYPNPEP